MTFLQIEIIPKKIVVSFQMSAVKLCLVERENDGLGVFASAVMVMMAARRPRAMSSHITVASIVTGRARPLRMSVGVVFRRHGWNVGIGRGLWGRKVMVGGDGAKRWGKQAPASVPM